MAGKIKIKKTGSKKAGNKKTEGKKTVSGNKKVKVSSQRKLELSLADIYQTVGVDFLKVATLINDGKTAAAEKLMTSIRHQKRLNKMMSIVNTYVEKMEEETEEDEVDCQKGICQEGVCPSPGPSVIAAVAASHSLPSPQIVTWEAPDGNQPPVTAFGNQTEEAMLESAAVNSVITVSPRTEDASELPLATEEEEEVTGGDEEEEWDDEYEYDEEGVEEEGVEEEIP